MTGDKKRLVQIKDFSDSYSSINAEQLEFLKSNFKGALAYLRKDNKVIRVSIDQIVVGDNVCGITKIPPSANIAYLNHEKIKLLSDNGLFSLVITTDAPPEKAPAAITKKDGYDSKESLEDAKKLLDKIEVAAEHRSEATDAVRKMLDDGRSGRYSKKIVEDMVDKIGNSGSTSAMKAISGLMGSDQTYAHCVDMSVILHDVYAEIRRMMGMEVSKASNRFTLIAGFMHDIGKSEVPKEILESTQRFEPDSREMIIMRNHTVYGARILERIGAHKTIINVSHYHHVKKDQSLISSYPREDYGKVIPLTRLAALADVYQALVGKRSYKSNWSPAKAVDFILKLKGSEFDEAMTDRFINVMGVYPVGSLLKLNTGAFGFVIARAPLSNPDRPLLGIVENKAGERLTNPEILDLMLNQDIEVVEPVDHYQHFNKTPTEAIEIFQSIQVN